MTLRYVVGSLVLAVLGAVAIAGFWIPLFNLIAACGGDCRANLGGH